MFEVAGLTFHLYGLILGLSIGLGWWLVMRQARAKGFSESELEKVGLWAVGGGVVGARIYHVATDWHLYQENWQSALYIWQGGLSVMGAVIGGGLVAWLVMRLMKPQVSLSQLLDLSAFGTPFAQALGRWGNFFNQELYGLPTTLPWGLPIETQHRLPGYELFEKFHPLFAYEMLLMLAFGGWIWWADRRQLSHIGRGEYFRWYLLFYAVVRFSLDFLRIDKTLLGTTGLGVNQAVLALVIVGLLLWEGLRKVNLRRATKVGLVGVMVVIGAGGWGLFQLNQQVFRESGTGSSCFENGFKANDRNPYTPIWSCTNPEDFRLPASDHRKTVMKLGAQTLIIEIVNSPESITQGLSDREAIGSDGMLFLLPPATSQPTFWMKDMHFALDMIWLKDGQVVDISTNVPPPRSGTPESQLPLISPKVPANMVLEVDAGRSQTWGIKVGDQLVPFPGK